MIRYVWYKSYSGIPCEQVKLTEYLKGGVLRGPWVSTRVRKYVRTVLIYSNHNFFQNHKIIHILFGNCLHSGGDIYMIRNKDNIKKCGWSLVRA